MKKIWGAMAPLGTPLDPPLLEGTCVNETYRKAPQMPTL